MAVLRPELVNLPGYGRQRSSWAIGGLWSLVPSAASELGGERSVPGNSFTDTGLVIVDFGADRGLFHLRPEIRGLLCSRLCVETWQLGLLAGCTISSSSLR